MGKILVICTACGGRGYREFLKDDNTWEKVECLACRGERYIEEEEFDVGKEKNLCSSPE